MTTFSQRSGLKPIRNLIQRESADEKLRNQLWNGLTIFYWKNISGYTSSLPIPYNILLTRIWVNHYGYRIDEIESYASNLIERVKQDFLKLSWNEMFDLLEFIPNNYKEESYNRGYDNKRNTEFINFTNKILKEHISAYRFVDKLITEITSEEEIASVESALHNSSNIISVHVHLRRALELLTDRNNPDYRNSIKESISAVESLAKIISNNAKDSLGAALDKIKSKVKIHSALERGFKQIYGYTSDDDGIRHALMGESQCDSEDAMFMLVSCSSFINYLIAKCQKADINIESL